MSLQTGTELASLVLAFNKATGFYGILTLFTGYVPSALQVSSYILSILIIAALAYLVPHVSKHSPFQVLALAWLYVIDTFVNVAYTSAFATTWYLATFHDPKGPAGKEAEMSGARDMAEGSVMGARTGTVDADSVASMVLVVIFTLVRIYFAFVVTAFARMVLQRWIGDEEGGVTEESESGAAPNPFAVGSALGEGWKGMMGRAMVSVGRGYWLGGRKEEEWARAEGAKFRRSTASV